MAGENTQAPYNEGSISAHRKFECRGLERTSVLTKLAINLRGFPAGGANYYGAYATERTWERSGAATYFFKYFRFTASLNVLDYTHSKRNSIGTDRVVIAWNLRLAEVFGTYKTLDSRSIAGLL